MTTRRRWPRTGQDGPGDHRGGGHHDLVFGSFVIGDPLHVLKVFGLGLAAAILIDATLVRMVLVPSVMELLGDTNWWMPSWLDRVVPKSASKWTSRDRHHHRRTLPLRGILGLIGVVDGSSRGVRSCLGRCRCGLAVTVSPAGIDR